jgi:CheY-like chemotaxis protein
MITAALTKLSGSAHVVLTCGPHNRRMLDEPLACLRPTSDGLRIMLIHGIAEPQLTRELARGGHDVLAVAAQDQAMRLLSVFDPQVILVVTPDVARTCRELRDYAADAPIVAIAANRDLDVRIAALEAGADDCVSSPFHPAELTARMRAAIRRGGPTSGRSRIADAPVPDGAA